MKLFRILSVLSFFMFGMGVFSQQYKNPAYEAYVNRFSNIAVQKMEQYGIPASITLAQGILESGVGQGRLAKQANNHFGIKCHDWTGEYVIQNDDEENECFRKYSTPEESYEDHSVFLQTRSRYAFLFQLKSTDYKGWAEGLQKAGYATDPNYANRLISLIEENGLTQFDKKKYSAGLISSSSKDINNRGRIVEKNIYGLRFVTANATDTYKSISKEFSVSFRRLLSWNDVDKSRPLKQGNIVYLQAKKTKLKEYSSLHYVEAGESMHSISQKYGLKLRSLYDLNDMEYDEKPHVGQKLYLR